MRVWELDAPRSLVLRSGPDPEPSSDEVAVEIAFTAVSPGTELHAYRSGPTQMMTRPGYLATGVVRAAGANVTTEIVGRRVVLSAPHGSTAVVEVSAITAIPDGVGSAESALTHLAGLGHASLHAGEYRAGDDVAVIGAGLVGLCAALVAEFAGARVQVIDIDPSRIEFARRIGLKAYDARASGVGEEVRDASSGGPAIVIDTSGAWEGLLGAAKIARRGTRVCVLGVNRLPPEPVVARALFDELLTFPARFHYEGIRLIGCAGHPRDAREEGGWTLGRCREYLLEAMARGRLDLAPLVTERLEPDALPNVMQRLDESSDRPLGVVLDWSRVAE